MSTLDVEESGSIPSTFQWNHIIMAIIPALEAGDGGSIPSDIQIAVVAKWSNALC